jgi:hypothetical protein
VELADERGTQGCGSVSAKLVSLTVTESEAARNDDIIAWTIMQ